MQPVFLTKAEVLRLHAQQISRYGGSNGLRDEGLLESAIAQPEASFGGEYLYGSLEEMAAAYLFHLVQNHAFIDGNKRIGLAACLVFLGLNGLSIAAEDDELYGLVLDVATGKAGKPEVASFLREHIVPA